MQNSITIKAGDQGTDKDQNHGTESGPAATRQTDRQILLNFWVLSEEPMNSNFLEKSISLLFAKATTRVDFNNFRLHNIITVSSWSVALVANQSP